MPDVNFSSSFSSIITILIVMLTVMLSTIYPALMAGRSANPGVARKWRMPKPEGDVMRFTFPFTVSAEKPSPESYPSFASILIIMATHRWERSLPREVTRLRAIESQHGQREMGITAEIALAPFRSRRLSAVHHDHQAIRYRRASPMEVVVELIRLERCSSGYLDTWQPRLHR